MAGHGIIINLDSKLPFIFTFNPENVENNKKINYVEAPNIGGASREKFFTGFANREISFSVVLMDKTDPLGVMEEISFFEALSEPSPGLLGIAGSFFGNENYPPPKVLFNWGTGNMVPLVWDVLDVKIVNTHFKSDGAAGMIGIPWRSEVTLSLSLDEDNIFNKANQIAKKVTQIAASVESVAKEMKYKTGKNRRRESL